MSEITAVSLFTGAGGMDIGFEHAGVRILCANELNRDACDTYAANHPKVRLICGDLAEHMDELKQYSPLFDEDVYDAISLATCVNMRNVVGGPSPDAVSAALDEARAWMQTHIRE